MSKNNRQKVVVQTIELTEFTSNSDSIAPSISEIKEIIIEKPLVREPIDKPTEVAINPPNLHNETDPKPISKPQIYNKQTKASTTSKHPATSTSKSKTIAKKTPKPTVNAVPKTKPTHETKKSDHNKTTNRSKTNSTPSFKDQKRNKLLAQAQESIDKIQKAQPTNSHSSGINKSIPSIGELQSEQFISLLGKSPETIYSNALISRLKVLLQMPEHGDVDIELTLSRSGKVIKLKVLRDESSINRLYIEKIIPTLSFPSFEPFSDNETQHTFAIRLTNQIF